MSYRLRRSLILKIFLSIFVGLRSLGLCINGRLVRLRLGMWRGGRI